MASFPDNVKLAQPGDVAPRVALAKLQGLHSEILTRAIGNVLSSPVAEVAYGQIIDGLPLSAVALDTYDSNACPGHPLLYEHLQLSPHVLETAGNLNSTFDPSTLITDATVIHAFQASSPGSMAFQVLLIELVARSVHEIAVQLFKQGPLRPTTDHLMSWRPSPDFQVDYRDGTSPTWFRHPWYRNYEQYPSGIADGVGYWAEAHILGGVVLFDRRKPGPAQDVDPGAIYFHSDSRDVTYRIYRLLDGQKQELLQFLLSEKTPPQYCPLPIHGDKDNRQRIDPEQPILETGIYRDWWERRPRSVDEGDSRLRDVLDDFNYISRDEWADAKLRAIEMRARLYREADAEDRDMQV